MIGPLPASLGRVVHKLQPQSWSSVAHPLAPGPAISCRLLSASVEFPILDISCQWNHMILGHLQLAYIT